MAGKASSSSEMKLVFRPRADRVGPPPWRKKRLLLPAPTRNINKKVIIGPKGQILRDYPDAGPLIKKKAAKKKAAKKK